MEPAKREALFAEAMKQHLGIFLKTAYAFTLPADRDDLVQEMLLAAWQALPSFDGTSKLSTFLYRVANNRALNWNRAQRRYGHKLAALEQCPQLTLEADDATTDNARLDWLYALIRELPPADRTVLLLQLDRLSHREIGEVTGLTENNVGVRLHRIKRWLSEKKETHHGP
ncbi:MAG: sigma-70 family RNA polymerase sigma factor [Opitutaceae bacterium]